MPEAADHLDAFDPSIFDRLTKTQQEVLGQIAIGNDGARQRSDR